MPVHSISESRILPPDPLVQLFVVAVLAGRAIGQGQDQHRQHTTGQGSGRVPMGQRSQLSTQPEDVLGRFVLTQALGEQTDRHNPHDAAAALAVVAGWLPEGIHRPQGR